MGQTRPNRAVSGPSRRLTGTAIPGHLQVDRLRKAAAGSCLTRDRSLPTRSKAGVRLQCDRPERPVGLVGPETRHLGVRAAPQAPGYPLSPVRHRGPLGGRPGAALGTLEQDEEAVVQPGVVPLATRDQRVARVGPVGESPENQRSPWLDLDSARHDDLPDLFERDIALVPEERRARDPPRGPTTTARTRPVAPRRGRPCPPTPRPDGRRQAMRRKCATRRPYVLRNYT